MVFEFNVNLSKVRCLYVSSVMVSYECICCLMIKEPRRFLTLNGKGVLVMRPNNG